MIGKLNPQTLLELILVLVIVPGMVPSVRAAQSQGPVKEPQKKEQSSEDANRLIKELFEASQSNNLEKLKELIAQRVDVNARNDEEFTPLCYAIREGYEELVRFLIDHGADINYTDKNGFSLLYYAIWSRSPAMVKVLASKGVDVNPAFGSYSPLHHAIWNQDLNTVKILVDCGAQFNEKDPDGWTAFYNAVWQGNREIVDFLVSKGADISSFHMTAAMGDVAGVNTFLEQGLAVDTKDEMECTPLSWATCMGQVEVVKLLIAQGADVNMKLYGQATALQQAARVGNSDIVQLLITNGADVNAKTARGLTPLDLAIRSGDVECIKLFSNNSDVDVNFSFISAVRQGDKESIEKLFDLGVDIDYQDNSGLTALNHAVISGNVSVVQLLLEHGARVDVRDNAGRAPLHYAAGANVFLEATQQWSVDIVQMLLDKKANINAKDSNGLTPLRYAIQIRDKSIIKLLVDRGSDLYSVDNNGYNPYSWIREQVSLLESCKGDLPNAKRLRQWAQQYKEIMSLLENDMHYYFVATNGDNLNSGTKEHPFASIDAAINNARPGDIILIRGGEYYPMKTIDLNRAGEYTKPICLHAYYGESPVFNFSRDQGCSLRITGSYWHLKGLIITGGYQGVHILGPDAHHNILEGIISFAHQYSGFLMRDGIARNIILNCDSYANFDPHWNGEYSDGFEIRFDTAEGNILIGNRAWNNSDDGFDFTTTTQGVRMEWCYAFGNGRNIWNYPVFCGDGNGFKLNDNRGTLPHLLINCIAWDNRAAGFIDLNENSGAILYSCVALRNYRNYIFSTMWSGILSNNISLEGINRIDLIPKEVNSQHNIWNSGTGLVLTDDDFLSLDDSQMSAPRNPDGSIPQNGFLKFAPGSAAIDKGVDVGMPFVGARPDLGAFEYDPNETSKGYVKMLHQAVRDHDVKQIEQLLAEGEGVNDKDWLGYTPLHWAVYFGYSDLIELLISKGADPNIQSDTGRYALEIARSMAYPDLEALLRKHGATAGDVPLDEPKQAAGESTAQ